MHEWLNDRVVFITGASRGIGRATALKLASARPRHIVIGYCSDYAAAHSAVLEVRSRGVEASAIATDVGREELFEELFDKLESDFGRLDIFISNAARAAFRSVDELSTRSWQRTMDLNARAFLVGGRRAAKLMRKGGGGRIVAVSSLGSRSVLQGYAALGAAKAALEATARYMAVEFAAYGINVNVVQAGFVDTDSTRSHPEFARLATDVATHTPTGRVGSASDIANAIAFLCSPDSDWVRGQTLVVDGGLSLVSHV